MTWLGVAGLIPVVCVLGFIYRKMSRHPFDPVALFCYMFVLFYLFRDIVTSFGWDSPYPNNLFETSQTGMLLLKASVVLTIFLVMFAVGLVVCRPIGGVVMHAFPLTPRVPRVASLQRLMVFLTIIATAITLFLFVHYGSFGGILRAGKVTKSLGGAYFLRIFPAVGSVIAASLCLTLLQRRREGHPSGRALTTFALACAILNAAYVYLWGSRAVVAAVIFILVAGQWQLGRGMVGSDEPRQMRPNAPKGRRAIRLLISVAILVGAVFGLRVIRDTALSGHVSTSIQGQSELRKISVATNSTHFDATLLAIRDWSSVYSYRDGEDFLIGVEGIVPRTLWSAKPTDITDGVWFRQVYQPKVKNGWPLGSVGDWYLDFGLIGIVAGGFLSGLIYAGLMAAWRSTQRSPFMIAALTCMVIFVVPTGFEALSPLDWFAWGLPLILCARYLNHRSRVGAEPILVA